MAVKRCCILNCDSCSTRKEDIGVTFHKFPKNPLIYQKWLNVTYRKSKVSEPWYVCSRHFCKIDFEKYMDSKYILKSDAVPSIFVLGDQRLSSNWSIMDKEETKQALDDSKKDENNSTPEHIISTQNIKQKIETVKQINQEAEAEIEHEKRTESDSQNAEGDKMPKVQKPSVSTLTNELQEKEEYKKNQNELAPNTKTESETVIRNNQTPCLLFGNNDLALSVGCLVEAKDFEEIWYPASIVEVDYDETEVLVHYENTSKKFDEWISVSSPRLRPWTNSVERDINEKINKEKVTDEVNQDKGNEREKYALEEILEDKPLLRFKVGERCLARWRDNRRFLATVSKDFGDGKYEIIFDDGFPWTCNVSRLVKVKPESDVFTVSSSSLNKSDQSPNLSNLTVSPGGEPIVTSSPAPIVPAASVPYHKHLFDPTRDYLGPKSERREMKRKLNIKDLFNIGTTKRRCTSKQTDKTKHKQPVLKALTERQADSKTKWKTTVKDTTQKDQINESVPIKSDKRDNFKNDTNRNADMKPKNISSDVPCLVDLTVHNEKESETPKELDKGYDENRMKKFPAESCLIDLTTLNEKKSQTPKELDKSDDEDSMKELPAVFLAMKPKRRELQVSIENIPLIELKRNLAKYKYTNSEDAKSEDTKSEDTKSEDTRSEDAKSEDDKSEISMAVGANSEDAKSQGTKSEDTRSADAKSEDDKSEISMAVGANSKDAKFEDDKTEDAKSKDVKFDYAELENIKSAHECKSESIKHIDTTIGELKSEEVISHLKMAIEKIEKNLNKCEGTEDVNVKMDNDKEEKSVVEMSKENKIRISSNRDWRLKRSKMRKAKKLRLLCDKRVKKEVEEVKNQLIEVKRQVEEMSKQVLLKSVEALPTIVESGPSETKEKPGTNEQSKLKKQQIKTKEKSVKRELLPGEWCCKWVNGHPQGIVSEVECDVKVDSRSKPVLPRRSVQVEDDRIPPGWTKHLVRRSFGSSAGQWNVVLVSPENRRFHTKVEVKAYMQSKRDESLKQYEAGLFDFGIHRRLSRKIGWDIVTCKLPVLPLPAKTVSASSPILSKAVPLKRGTRKTDKGLPKKRKQLVEKRPKMISTGRGKKTRDTGPSTSQNSVSEMQPPEPFKLEPEEGYVYVGSLKVQIIETLLRCPAEECFKNFRNTTLLQMHIKHYHRELRKMLGATPKVLDLAYARTMPLEVETQKTRLETEHKTPRLKMSKLKRSELEPRTEPKDFKPEISKQHISSPPEVGPDMKTPRSVDSPKLRNALISNQPVRRPKVLLPVRRIDMTEKAESSSPKPVASDDDDFSDSDDRPLDISGNDTGEPVTERPTPMDYELEISSHTVTKPIMGIEKHKKRVKSLLPVHRLKQMSAVASEEDEWCASDLETRSSYPNSGTPDSKNQDKSMDTPPQLMSSESNDEARDENVYINEAGERIKIVQMEREDIVNCHCGFREGDGLMIQCDLCLCWQHALCHNIQQKSEVPEKHTCSICLNPRRGRRSQRFLHDQDRLYEGLLPGGRPEPVLRRAHELSGNLLRFTDALHALRVKSYVATKKDHPKLYLWAKDWENGDISDVSEEKLNSDYLNLCNIMSDVGKENLPIKTEDLKDLPLMDVRTANVDEDGQKREGQPVTQPTALSPSTGAPVLDIPISPAELERLAKSVQGDESAADAAAGAVALVAGAEAGVVARVAGAVARVAAGAVARVAAGPQPEPAIEDSACRKRLSRHIKRSHALIDARLDSIEAQIAELEAQYPSFEDDETADFFPRTKQTIQMLIRDLSNMEELGLTS